MGVAARRLVTALFDHFCPHKVGAKVFVWRQGQKVQGTVKYRWWNDRSKCWGFMIEFPPEPVYAGQKDGRPFYSADPIYGATPSRSHYNDYEIEVK